MKDAITHNFNDPALYRAIIDKISKVVVDRAHRAAEQVVKRIEDESAGRVKPQIVGVNNGDKLGVNIVIDKPEEIKIYKEKGLDKIAADMMVRLMKK